ncbi:MAG: D-aminopeptidase [Proteobacteria bacterium]|nr:D-aminopeptidase [Pseudomonadota bacterium]MBS0571651.1 D-aminopeptidase [Pseudomonadota bacterium]
MTARIDRLALDRALEALPGRFRGPGGVAGVVLDGEVITRRAWGYADLERGQPMTPATLIPICSVSKQFTCAVLLDLVGDPARLDARVAGFLPRLQGRMPLVADLCNMQSGLRDYWALTVLHGAHPEGRFRREDAGPLLARMRTTHFEPGSGYSYSNGNFRILSDLIEDHAGRPLADLYRDRIFARAGMETACLAADTGAGPHGVTGHEGNDGTGFFPAVNRIYWTGDAGIAASLDDMLAWERHIDATRGDEGGLYRRLSRPQTFRDGAPARYGFGLSHETVAGLAATGHGGALRGFRICRLHVPARRLSVVVMFNHEADAHEAARLLAQAALGEGEPPPPASLADSAWSGRYLDRENGLLLAVEAEGGWLGARYATSAERLRPGPDGIAASPLMTLRRDGDRIRVERPGENLRAEAFRVSGEAGAGLEGSYVSDETGGRLEVGQAGGALFGRFEGLLGRGPLHAIHPAGRDLFALSCQRSMDAPAPGEWTVQVRRNAAGGISGLVIGCWLARNIAYAKLA